MKWLVLAVVAIWLAVLALPDGKLHVVFCDVGQGDAILVSLGTNQLLIDGGPNDKVIGCLANHVPFYDRRIEVVVLTHDDSDHSFGLSLVRERYNVLQFEPKLVKGDTVKMGGAQFVVEWPEKEVLGKENIEAIIGRVEYGYFSVLLTSDTPTRLYPDETGLEVVKVPHHGSKTDFDPGWWEKVKPNLAVISVGKNSYGHPTEEVLTALKNLGIRILRTDQEGDIEVVSNGVKWWVK